TLAVALLFAALSFPAFAQSPADREDHHPGSNEVQAPAQAGPPGWRRSMMDDEDMMGPGMMGPGMMGRGMMGRGMMSQRMMGRGMMREVSMGPSMMFRMIFALMDADGDGTVSLPEFQAAHERIFKAMDGNKDGKLTLEEMLTFMRGSGNPAPKQ